MFPEDSQHGYTTNRPCSTVDSIYPANEKGVAAIELFKKNNLSKVVTAMGQGCRKTIIALFRVVF